MAENKDGRIWIGTDGGGLNLYDPLTKQFRHFRHETGNKNSICGDYVLSVCEDSKGNVWVGTWADGITVFNPQKNTYQHFKNDPMFLPVSAATMHGSFLKIAIKISDRYLRRRWVEFI
jgi:sugar lactone lactonase YvrE